MLTLTQQHIKLYQTIRRRGEGRYCNDLEKHEAAMLNQTQWREFAKAFDAWNGEPEVFEERTNYVLSDFMVTAYIEHVLVESYFRLQGLEK